MIVPQLAPLLLEVRHFWVGSLFDPGPISGEECRPVLDCPQFGDRPAQLAGYVHDQGITQTQLIDQTEITTDVYRYQVQTLNCRV